MFLSANWTWTIRSTFSSELRTVCRARRCSKSFRMTRWRRSIRCSSIASGFPWPYGPVQASYGGSASRRRRSCTESSCAPNKTFSAAERWTRYGESVARPSIRAVWTPHSGSQRFRFRRLPLERLPPYGVPTLPERGPSWRSFTASGSSLSTLLRMASEMLPCRVR